jgi:putative DNA primase/helicase
MGDEKIRDLGTFKKLTGRDTMTADVKYEKPITFENHATLMFAANRMPAMDEDTHALWRRWIYINFPNTFEPDDAKTEPKRVLMRRLTTDEQMSGLLNRCVEEIGEWWEGRDFFPGIMAPSEVREKMKRASEPIYDFLVTCTELDEDGDAFVQKDDLRAAYQQYAAEEGLPAQSDNVFGEKVLNVADFPIEGGQRRMDGRRMRVYNGIELSSRGRQVLGLDEVSDDDDQSGLDGGVQKWAADVVRIVREMQPDEGGVAEAMIIGRATSEMQMEHAKQGIERARKQGDLYDCDDGLRAN